MNLEVTIFIQILQNIVVVESIKHIINTNAYICIHPHTSKYFIQLNRDVKFLLCLHDYMWVHMHVRMYRVNKVIITVYCESIEIQKQ